MKHMTPFDYTRQQEAKLKEMGVEFEPVSSSVYFQTEEKRCMGFIEAWQAIGSPMLRPKQGLDGKWTEARSDKPTARARVSQSGELYNVVQYIHYVYYVCCTMLYNSCTTMYIVTCPTFT
jgi:hypothetical protein